MTKKTILTIIFCAAAFLASANGYEHSVGVSLGGFNGLSYKGFIFGHDNLALQIDLGARVSNMGIPGRTHVHYPGFSEYDFIYPRRTDRLVYYTLEVNPNIIYQSQFGSSSACDFSWLAGGGISLGAMEGSDSWKHMGQIHHYVETTYPDGTSYYDDYWTKNPDPYSFKFGINAITGVEVHFSSAPIALAAEFRLGYGLLVEKCEAGEFDGTLYHDDITSYSFFDWSLGLALRYTF